MNVATASSSNPVKSAEQSTNEPILSLVQMNVQRGDFLLCQGVSVQLVAGDICHLIGENGLGKTTLMSQIAGLLPIMTGAATVQGACVYVSHQLGISPALTVGQNLRFLLSLYGVRADDATLDDALMQVGLQGLADVSSVQLSAGQMRRVGLARLFVLDVADAPFWLLDEPLTALDVAMVARLEARIGDFARNGGAVLMTSHQATQATNCTLDLAEFAV